MKWQIEFTKVSKKYLKKQQPQISKRIINFLYEKIRKNPRDIGEPLKGQKLGSYWKYRIGSYRVIADIRDNELLILIIRIGDRKEVYKS